MHACAAASFFFFSAPLPFNPVHADTLAHKHLQIASVGGKRQWDGKVHAWEQVLHSVGSD